MTHEPFDTTFDWSTATRTHTVHGSVLPDVCPVHGNPWVPPLTLSNGTPAQLKHYTCGCEWCVDMPDWEYGMYYFYHHNPARDRNLVGDAL